MKAYTNEQMFFVDLDDEYDFFVPVNCNPIPVGPMMSSIYRSVEDRQYDLDHLFDEEPAVSVPIRKLDYNHSSYVDVPGHEMSERGAIVTRDNGFVVDLGYQIAHVTDLAASAYYASGLHTDQPDIAAYNAYIAAGVAPEITVPTLKQSDGQLKILTDFVLGVDAMVTRVSKSSYKILVVGSASESGVSGLAYGILSRMNIKCDIHLYDSCERENNYVEGDVHYYYHRGLWKYGDDVSEFDIVFDDAYDITVPAEVCMRQHLDPNRTILAAKDYSIKCLYSDALYFKDLNLYCQASITPSNEHRCVKFPRIYGRYRPFFEGTCPFCTQLKYLLTRVYDWNFFEYFLRVHRTPCVRGFRKFPRHVQFRNDCCRRTTSTFANRLLVCVTHSSYIGFLPVRKISTMRQLYTPRIPYDFDKLEFWDVIIESTSDRGIGIITVDLIILLIARSIIIRHQGQYFVSHLMLGENVYESKVNFRYVCPK